jgi:diguanylate cyclase (GGDEF)-like protein/PAS domain S-box-containing protein
MIKLIIWHPYLYAVDSAYLMKGRLYMSNKKDKGMKYVLQEHEKIHHILLDKSSDPIFSFNSSGKYLYVNRAFAEGVGKSLDQIIGKKIWDVFDREEADKRFAAVNHVFQSGEEKVIEVRVPRADGDKYFITTITPIINNLGKVMNVICSSKDITDRKRSENTLFNEKERLKTILLSVGDGVIVTDRNAKVELLNPVAEQLTGWTQNEAYGKPFEEVFHIINELTRERCDDPSHKVLNTGINIGLGNHTILISKEGIEIPVEDSAAPIKDKDGNITGIVMVFRDFTEKKKRQAEFEYLSYHDQLTGLYNRRFYEVELKRLDTKRNIPITIVMADVNGLKLTNDAFGHKAGDILLQKIVNIIKRECRADEIIARIGGDEFVILLPKTDSEQAEIIVNRINDNISKEPADPTIMSVSFGWETKRNTMQDLSEVFKKAEDEMYRRKLLESASMRNKTIELIIKTLYKKNSQEQQHSARVSQLCVAIGEALELSNEDINQLRSVGLMHDIGKIVLDERILNKSGTLSDIEWIEIKRHSENGYRILSSVNEFVPIAQYILTHHERWDGRGYPHGLKGTDIPLQARIIAVAEAYDAMGIDGPCRQALNEEAAIQEIKSNAGTQFDPEISKIFVEKVLSKRWK